MEAMILEWLNLAARGLHVVAGIAWIGASFYFIWLDLSLGEPPEAKRERGVAGDLWAIHGGGIYEISKYRLGPPRMPEFLHWFKWEAYTTWISGSLLLVLLYYVQAESYLVGMDAWIQGPAVVIGASIAFLAAGQLAYEGLLRTSLVGRGLVFAVALLLLTAAASWLAHQLFSARAAYLHVGAMVATWMAGNVFWGIIPAQKQFVAAASEDRSPDAELARFAKLRSSHNNYLTLPVVFAMLSNHYPFLYASDYGWVLLVAVGGLLAWLRHFFNLKHQGVVRLSTLILPLAGLVMVAAVTVYLEHGLGSGQPTTSSEQAISGKLISGIVDTHCAGCHASNPENQGFSAPPAGLILDSPAALRRHAGRSLNVVKSGYMPLGNPNGMTEKERELLVRWLNVEQSLR